METATHSFPALGTVAVVATTDPGRLHAAAGIVMAEVSACDAACSRFRHDSDLARLNAGAGRYVDVSLRLIEDLAAALWAARLTGGVIDPTVGQALVNLGYDRDFSAIPPDGVTSDWPGMVTFSLVPGSTAISIDRARRRVRVPEGVRVDLGSTAKARSADLAARAAADAVGCGVLVGLGGDISVAGPPPEGGWGVRVTDDARAPADVPGQIVAISSGGIATSGTTVRSWRRGDREVHHVIDPRTGLPAGHTWRTVTVAASSCLQANVAPTAAIVMGNAAPTWLDEHHLPARLVRPDGSLVRVGAWPADQPRQKVAA